MTGSRICGTPEDQVILQLNKDDAAIIAGMLVFAKAFMQDPRAVLLYEQGIFSEPVMMSIYIMTQLIAGVDAHESTPDAWAERFMLKMDHLTRLVNSVLERAK